MFYYFEYVKSPEGKNIKMIYPHYREDFNVSRNPKKYYLDKEQFARANSMSTRIIFSSLVTGTYISLYYYFHRNLSKY